MLKFERTDKTVRVETNENLLEIMADITLLIKVVYEHLEKTTKKSFVMFSAMRLQSRIFRRGTVRLFLESKRCRWLPVSKI